MATIKLQDGKVITKEGNVSCTCCVTLVKSIIAEFNKIGVQAFDGSKRWYAGREFIDDGGENCGVGTSFCRFNNCNQEVLVSCTEGPSGGCACGFTMCPGGIETITSPTRLDVQCPPEACGDDHIILSEEFTTDDLLEKIDELLSYSFDGIGYGNCAYTFFSGENCGTVSANISPCEDNIYSYFYTDNELNNSETFYAQKKKSIFLATSSSYCKKTFNNNGILLSSETISCVIGNEYIVEPPINIGYITLETGQC